MSAVSADIRRGDGWREGVRVCGGKGGRRDPCTVAFLSVSLRSGRQPRGAVRRGCTQRPRRAPSQGATQPRHGTECEEQLGFSPWNFTGENAPGLRSRAPLDRESEETHGQARDAKGAPRSGYASRRGKEGRRGARGRAAGEAPGPAADKRWVTPERAPRAGPSRGRTMKASGARGPRVAGNGVNGTPSLVQGGRKSLLFPAKGNPEPDEAMEAPRRVLGNGKGGWSGAP